VEITRYHTFEESSESSTDSERDQDIQKAATPEPDIPAVPSSELIEKEEGQDQDVVTTTPVKTPSPIKEELVEKKQDPPQHLSTPRPVRTRREPVITRSGRESFFPRRFLDFDTASSGPPFSKPLASSSYYSEKGAKQLTKQELKQALDQMTKNIEKKIAPLKPPSTEDVAPARALTPEVIVFENDPSHQDYKPPSATKPILKSRDPTPQKTDLSIVNQTRNTSVEDMDYSNYKTPQVIQGSWRTRKDDSRNESMEEVTEAGSDLYTTAQSFNQGVDTSFQSSPIKTTPAKTDANLTLGVLQLKNSPLKTASPVQDPQEVKPILPLVATQPAAQTRPLIRRPVLDLAPLDQPLPGTQSIPVPAVQNKQPGVMPFQQSAPQPLPQVVGPHGMHESTANQSVMPMDYSVAPTPAPLVKPPVFSQYRDMRFNRSMDSTLFTSTRESPMATPHKSPIKMQTDQVSVSSQRSITKTPPGSALKMQVDPQVTQYLHTPMGAVYQVVPVAAQPVTGDIQMKEHHSPSKGRSPSKSFSMDQGSPEGRRLDKSFRMEEDISQPITYVVDRRDSTMEFEDPDKTMEWDLTDLYRTPPKQQAQSQSTILEDFDMQQGSPRTPRDEFLQESYISPSLLPPAPPERWPQTRSVKRSDPPSPDIPSMSSRRDGHLTLTPKRNKQHDQTQNFEGTTFLDASGYAQYDDNVPFGALNLETRHQYQDQAFVQQPPVYRAFSDGHRPSQQFNPNLYRPAQQPQTSTPHRPVGAALLPMVTPIVQAGPNAHQINTPNTLNDHQQTQQDTKKTKRSKKQKPQAEPYSRPVREKKPIDRYGY
jgi:hypothetical protein